MGLHVKRLEVQGFKSFKDKTVIHFDERITGIVGPNGCGKSNVVDAFFWVMGEQSYKHMRGSGSQDLIFNGSSKYPPATFAEATLVLETEVTDLDANTKDAPMGATVHDVPLSKTKKEISVTRRVYRSGEGEYFINGIQSRLKDIHELFMDTGVGTKGGYSIIEQGQIGKIVNSKPEDRRQLIEEAAGIAKYKARKRESLRKLEATEANLGRLQDVIQEIERNLNSLERQAQKAKQYKKLKEELTQKEVHWGRRKSFVLDEQMKKLEELKTTLEQEVIGLRAELQTTENDIQVQRNLHTEKSKLFDEEQTKITELSDLLSSEKSALELSKRRKEDLEKLLQSLESEKSEIEIYLASEKESLSGKESDLQNSEQIFKEIAEKSTHEANVLSERKSKLQDIRNEIQGLQKQLQSERQEENRFSSKITSARAKLEAYLSQVEKHAEEQNELQHEISTLVQELEEGKNHLELSEKNLLESDQAYQAALLGKSEQKEALKQIHEDRVEKEKAFHALSAKLQGLKELDQALEGFGQGSKNFMKWMESSGLTTEFCSLPHVLKVKEGYEKAVEGFLERELERVFSRSIDQAKSAYLNLGSTLEGRVSIEIPSVNFVEEDPISKDHFETFEAHGIKVHGFLSEFVEIQKSETLNQNEMDNLFSSVILVDSIEPVFEWLKEACSKLTKKVSFVTLQGDVLDRGSLVRFGRENQEAEALSVLSRKTAIEELEKTIQEMSLELSSILENEKTKEEAFSALEIELEAMLTRYQEYKAEVRSQSQSRDGLEERVSKTRSLVERKAQEKEQIESQIKTLEEEVRSSDEQLSLVHTRISDLEIKFSDESAKEVFAEEEVISQEKILSEIKIEEAQSKERFSGLSREMDTARRVITDREKRLSELLVRMEQATIERSQFLGTDDEKEQAVLELAKNLSDYQAGIRAIKDELESLNQSVSEGHDKLKTLHDQGEKKNNAVSRHTIELEKLISEKNYLLQNLTEKYGADCLENGNFVPYQEEMQDPILTNEMTEEEEKILFEDVERLKEKLRKLGEVNVMAVEEYEDLKKRYDYLSTEKADLIHSMDNLREAIDHINQTSEDRFRKAYDAISDRFSRLFPIIFGGGSASMQLVYPEGVTDILEAGIEIMAQPPGKKVSSITLLSGGEKALTALSLIFAIFMVKPSPFCILDEVDAPLDDANIGKFNAILNEMATKSQFILITHNKKTMELNDILYGVTMEEPGVSKMISIEMGA